MSTMVAALNSTKHQRACKQLWEHMILATTTKKTKVVREGCMGSP